MKEIKRVLVANRGEIAERIARTARLMGIEPLIVYSAGDRETIAVRNAKESFFIGAAQVSESYLNMEKILQVARDAKADAIHPGYGLLSENVQFAEKVKDAGLIWIGPSPQTMHRLSSKSEAKKVALEAGVPILPSFTGEQDSETFKREASRIGYPVLLKAAAGGGGRGIRKVEDERELLAQFDLAKSEAQNAFGSGELLIEKYLAEAHHIEVQVLGDCHGQVVHLGERDCSVQRRHQKLIEESPSPALDASTREKILRDAVKLAKACGYENAGTVEFLLSPQREYFFLEVNTRLQVEHPVTEEVTGLDLVEWQFRVARGEKLPLTQDEVRFQGYAMEARIYAEDSYREFQPQIGRTGNFYFPAGVRVDHFLTPRSEISPYYDSMMAKLIVRAKDRERGIQAMENALKETAITGLKTNRGFLLQILRGDFFKNGKTYTRSLGEASFQEETGQNSEFSAGLAAVAHYLRESRLRPSAQAGWSNNPLHASFLILREGARNLRIALAHRGAQFEVRIGKQSIVFSSVVFEDPVFSATSEGVSHRAIVFFDAGHVDVLYEGFSYRFFNPLAASTPRQTEIDLNALAAPLAGTVTKISVHEGAKVAPGDVLAVIEAMKMQFELRAPQAATVKSVSVRVGEQVKTKQVILRFDS